VGNKQCWATRCSEVDGFLLRRGGRGSPASTPTNFSKKKNHRETIEVCWLESYCQPTTRFALPYYSLARGPVRLICFLLPTVLCQPAAHHECSLRAASVLPRFSRVFTALSRAFAAFSRAFPRQRHFMRDALLLFRSR